MFQKEIVLSPAAPAQLLCFLDVARMAVNSLGVAAVAVAAVAVPFYTFLKSALAQAVETDHHMDC